IKSVNGKEASLEAVLPLAKKYGAALVALCLDENGIPETADGRIAVAKKILSRAAAYGIPQKDILIDGLTMAVSAAPDSALTTLETIRRAKEELHCRTVLGVSNVSFGLPARPAVNAAFLTMAMQNGLSLAIMNPNDVTMHAALMAGNALLMHDRQGLRFSETFADIAITEMSLKTGTGAPAATKGEKAAASVGLKTGADTSALTLQNAVERGLAAAAEERTRALLKEGKAPLKIIEEHLVPALNAVGEAYEKGRLYLPQLLMSADAAKAAFAVLQGALKGQPQQEKGRVILATVRGDIHDIGKNIVRVMLENYGFTVLDLGKDVEPETVAEAAEKGQIRLVGLSALMTTTVPAMEETIRLLKSRVPGVKVMAGGAVLTKEYAERIGADAYGKDAMAAVRYAQQVFADPEA
ncbi:MAG: cobalamin-dependent protein, partial [Lachnospiraceae bacterium]|nr:cobalamin-dependent protein [Lachnospiraceae bacterium]